MYCNTGTNGKLFGDMLFRAMPLIMTGLSVAVAYQTGLFNIGAPGQYLMGTAVTIIVALSLDSSVLPAWLIWVTAFLAAGTAGTLWGCIPGFFKAYLNVNEVLTSIMTNWIAANIVAVLFDGSNFINSLDYGKTGYTFKLNTNGISTATLGMDKIFPDSYANAGFFVAVIIAIILFLSGAAAWPQKQAVAGFGYLALAVMIFGNWKPQNIAAVGLLFGLLKCIAACYGTLDINGDGIYLLANIGVSNYVYNMLPYLVTMAVLAFTSKKSRAPKAEGIPYDKGQR